MAPSKIFLSVTWVMFRLRHSIFGADCSEDDSIFGDRQMMIIHVNGVFEHCVRLLN